MVRRNARRVRKSMALFFVFIFGLPIAWVVYGVAHGQKPFQTPLPPGVTQPTR